MTVVYDVMHNTDGDAAMIKKFYRKGSITALCFACTLVCTVVFASGGGAARAASEAEPKVFRQQDLCWSQYATGPGNLGDSGCGLLSITNAVYYMNGNFIDPTELAEWAYSIDAYLIYEGSGSIRGVLYPALEEAFGEKYGFTLPVTEAWSDIDDERLTEHLKGDGVAICHVENHFIAVVDYNEKTKKFLVLDSSPNIERRYTTCSGDWLTAAQLSGDKEVGGKCYMKVDWFCLISPADKAGGDFYRCSIDMASSLKSGTVTFGADLTEVNFAAGETVSFRASPAMGYKIKYVKCNGREIDATNYGDAETFRFEMPAENVKITVKFEKENAVEYQDRIDISAVSYDINGGIIICPIVKRGDIWIGLFDSEEKDFTVENAYFYYILNGRNGETVILNSQRKGGCVSEYDSGEYKAVAVTSGGKAVCESAAINITGVWNGPEMAFDVLSQGAEKHDR